MPSTYEDPRDAPFRRLHTHECGQKGGNWLARAAIDAELEAKNRKGKRRVKRD
jgi:hypothetical protein